MNLGEGQVSRMTNAEAIETIKTAIAEVGWNYPMDYTVAFEEAIMALEKQIPKKPIKSDNEIRYCEVWKCPSCGFEWSSRVVDFCYKCGQHIDWSEA